MKSRGSSEKVDYGRVSRDKKARVIGTKPAGEGPGRRNMLRLGAAGVVVVALGLLALAAGPLGLFAGDSGPYYKLSGRRYDPSQPLQQTAIEPEYRDGSIYLDLATLDREGIVVFSLPDRPLTLPNGTSFESMPVTAFVAPSGKVTAAVSFCEPCSGTSFHIRGDRLVCNACFTQWSLESLKGISGGCMDYPPDSVSYAVDGEYLVLDEWELRSWVPRG
ncbi:MAG: DUF2318 domain-containing protein [Bacillota bacterium]|nr:MAG: DUF2318 domain-containing protein [Bacillota bacterium]